MSKLKFEITKVTEHNSDGVAKTLIESVPLAQGGGALKDAHGKIQKGFFKKNSLTGAQWLYAWTRPERKAVTDIQKELEAERDAEIAKRKKELFGNREIIEGLTFEADVETVDGYIVIQ